MNHEEFEKLVERRLEHCRKVLCSKGEEYSKDGNRLWNFDRAAAMCDSSPSEALWGMMAKHLVSLHDIVQGHARGLIYPQELVDEKIGDTINYCLLLEGIITRKEG